MYVDAFIGRCKIDLGINDMQPHIIIIIICTLWRTSEKQAGFVIWGLGDTETIYSIRLLLATKYNVS